MVVPLHRPRDLRNVFLNFSRQDYPDRRLVIVENGAAVGECRRTGLIPDMLLSASSGPAEALNVALYELRKRDPSGWFFKVDADDYYGPRYLSEAMAVPAEANATGKGGFWLRTVVGRLWRFGFPESQWASPEAIPQGPTLAARVADCLPFNDVRPWGEDIDWVARMLGSGARIWLTSRNGFCQLRSPTGHTWVATDEAIRCLALETPCWDAGPWSAAVVDGAPPSRLVAVPGRALGLRERPAYLAAQSV